jgi:hypothetical protein
MFQMLRASEPIAQHLDYLVLCALRTHCWTASDVPTGIGCGCRLLIVGDVIG